MMQKRGCPQAVWRNAFLKSANQWMALPRTALYPLLHLSPMWTCRPKSPVSESSLLLSFQTQGSKQQKNLWKKILYKNLKKEKNAPTHIHTNAAAILTWLFYYYGFLLNFFFFYYYFLVGMGWINFTSTLFYCVHIYKYMNIKKSKTVKKKKRKQTSQQAFRCRLMNAKRWRYFRTSANSFLGNILVSLNVWGSRERTHWRPPTKCCKLCSKLKTVT